MTNDEIVYALPHLEFLQGELSGVQTQIKTLEAQIDGLMKQEERLKREVQCLSNITKVDRGIALVESEYTISGKGLRVGAPGDDQPRSAEVYANAHTVVDGVAHDWCIKVYDRKRERSNDEKWLGNGWGYADAVRIAVEWTVTGELPSDEHEQMCKAFHKHAPKLSKKLSLPDALARSDQRREAFEAAWLAGHHELAIEILGRRKSIIRTKRAA